MTSELQTIKEALLRLEQYTLLSVKPVLDIEEAAAFTGISKRTLYELTANREIPYYKKGIRVYFRKDELEAWLTETRILTNQEVENRAATHVALKKLNISINPKTKKKK
jgi:excisionase family DNA binding protein